MMRCSRGSMQLVALVLSRFLSPDGSIGGPVRLTALVAIDLPVVDKGCTSWLAVTLSGM